MDMPGAGPVLKFMHDSEKKQIESERSAVQHGSGRAEDKAARLRTLDDREKASDSMYAVMTKAVSLQSGRLAGADVASISAERQAQGPAAGLLAQGTSKTSMGEGVNLSLGPSLDLGMGGSKDSDGTAVTKMFAQEAAADARLEDRLKPGERDEEPDLVPKDEEPGLVPTDQQPVAGAANVDARTDAGQAAGSMTGGRLGWLAPSADARAFVAGLQDLALRLKGP